MKARIIGLITVFMFAAVMVFAQSTNKTEKFKVKGNGEACKERIEEAATSVEGVTSAEWDIESKMLTVEFDENVTTRDEIEVALAEVGHDTPNHKAKDEAYEKLPEGSKYREGGELNEEKIEEEVEEEVEME